MAIPSLKLVSALRKTADRVETGVRYEWGHMAHCNCGHLVQTITDQDGQQLSGVIKQSLDEWTEHASDVCPISGNVDSLFYALLDYGFEREDIVHLEWLSDEKVLRRLGTNIHLARNERQNLVLYLRTMAEMLEEELAQKMGTLLVKSAAMSGR